MLTAHAVVAAVRRFRITTKTVRTAVTRSGPGLDRVQAETDSIRIDREAADGLCLLASASYSAGGHVGATAHELEEVYTYTASEEGQNKHTHTRYLRKLLAVVVVTCVLRWLLLI